MNETLVGALYGISFILSLFVMVGLWWVTVIASQARRFWGLLALGWTLNLVADLSWSLIFVLAPGLWLDWIDYLYFGRYLLIFSAFLIYPQFLNWRHWLGMLVSVLAGWLLIWLLLARPAQNPDPVYVWAGMIFPVLDVGIAYVAVYRWHAAATLEKPALRWIMAAMLSYGVANWFNYSLRVTDPEADSLPALILWLLSTIFAGLAVWRAFKWGE